jgi:hypothetical protein
MNDIKKPKSSKREKGDLIKDVRDLAHPDLLRIPKKNPTLHYRWVRNTPENLSVMEAKGYRVATADEVRATGLKPGVDGSMVRGDLILCVEEYSHHKMHREKEAELQRRQSERVVRGRPVRAGGWDFNETIERG